MRSRNQREESFDSLDFEILKLLQKDGRAPFLEIARTLKVAGGTVRERIARLRERGILRGFSADIDFRKMGWDVTALVGLRTELADKIYRTIEELRKIAEIEEIHVVTGDFDIIVKVRAKNPLHLQEILLEKIDRVFGFHRSTTMILLSSPVEKIGIALDEIQEEQS
jgi:Lrp/AsnC family transcriptional regulator for asnA, asnC and gidA